MTRRLRGTVFAWCVACCASAAVAGAIGITPVRLTLRAGHTVSALTVSNSGAEATVVQVELLRWSQAEGAEQLSPTRELLATPPIFTLPPGGTQIVRVGLRGRPPDDPVEQAYRLLLKEVPPASAADVPGVRIALNISLPVFVLPALPSPSVPVLRWQARRAEGGLRLHAENDGPAHVQVTGLRLAGGERVAQFVSGYLLPGARREWQVSHDAAVGSLLSLVAYTDAGELATQVLVTASQPP